MPSMELLGRSFLQAGSASTAAPRGGRERGGGGLCFASLGGRQGRPSRRTVRSKAPVGALAERVVLTPAPAERVARPEAHPQSVAARAVVTVRRKRKVEVKEQVAEQMDAYADRVGRSVLLELISTETDPSKPPSPPRSFPAAFEFRGPRAASLNSASSFLLFRFPFAASVENPAGVS